MKGNDAIAPCGYPLRGGWLFRVSHYPAIGSDRGLDGGCPWKTTGMVVLQAESEVSAINMVYGGRLAGST